MTGPVQDRPPNVFTGEETEVPGALPVDTEPVPVDTGAFSVGTPQV